MRIDGSGSYGLLHLRGRRPEEVKLFDEALNPHKAGKAEAQQELPPVPPVQGDEERSSGARGVIRNLLDGHYKGVADLRLRINFASELAAVQESALREAAPGKVDEFLDNFSAEAEALLADVPEEQAEEAAALLEDFRNAAGELATDYAENGEGGPEALVLSLETAFQGFADGLAGLLGVSVPEESEGEEAELAEVAEEESDDAGTEGEEALAEADLVAETEAEAGDEPNETLAEPEAATSAPVETTAFDGQTLLNALAGSFADALSGLNADFGGFSVLPEPSAPQGQGKAYAKFLQAYQEIYNLTAAPTPERAESVDILV